MIRVKPKPRTVEVYVTKNDVLVNGVRNLSYDLRVNSMPVQNYDNLKDAELAAHRLVNALERPKEKV